MNISIDDSEIESELQDLTNDFRNCSISTQQVTLIDYEQHEDDTGLAFKQQLQWCMQNDLYISNGW